MIIKKSTSLYEIINIYEYLREDSANQIKTEIKKVPKERCSITSRTYRNWYVTKSFHLFRWLYNWSPNHFMVPTTKLTRKNLGMHYVSITIKVVRIFQVVSLLITSQFHLNHLHMLKFSFLYQTIPKNILVWFEPVIWNVKGWVLLPNICLLS